MIDVVFLLLTFFIYGMVTMVQARVLPISLTTLTAGEQAEPAAYAAITIDRTGELYFNREPISEDKLDQRLQRLARRDDPPRLLLAMQRPNGETPATQPVDRGPLLISLIERVRGAGLDNFAIVGDPPR